MTYGLLYEGGEKLFITKILLIWVACCEIRDSGYPTSMDADTKVRR